jgi:hypothetical protein
MDAFSHPHDPYADWLAAWRVNCIDADTVVADD